MQDFEVLLTLYESALLKECWKYYKQNADVWELFQDATIKMCKSFHTFRPEKKFLPWARKVIYSAYSDRKRAEAREFGDCELCYRQQLDAYATIEPEVEESAEMILTKLLPEDADLIRAVYMDGIAQTSLAKMMGVSQQLISKRLLRAKRRFQEAYNMLFGYSDRKETKDY